MILWGRDRAVTGHGTAYRTELQPECFARKLLDMQHSIFAVRFHVDHYWKVQQTLATLLTDRSVMS